MFYMYSKQKLTCTNINKESKITQILNFIKTNKEATKFECVSKILEVQGTKRDLRGYYSVVFQELRLCGVLDYSFSNFKYSLTEKGLLLLEKANKKVS